MKIHLIPQPKQTTYLDGYCQVKLCFQSDGSHVLYETVSTLFKGKTPNIQLRVDKNIPEQGYVLTVSKCGAEICASGAEGHFYGALTLSQLVEKSSNGKVPCVRITDAPKCEHRGVQINYGQDNVRWNRKWLVSFIKRCAALKINYIYLYFEWNYNFESVPGLTHPFYANKEEIKKIIEIATAYNVTIVPQFNFLGHSKVMFTKERFAGLREAKDRNSPVVSGTDFCISDPVYQDMVARLVDEVCEVFPSEVIHCGGDEVGRIGECEGCKEEFEKYGKLGMYLRYFIQLSERLKIHGKKLGIWGDVSAKLCDGSPFWEGCNVEKEREEQNLKLLYELKDNLIVYDWWYYGRSKISTDFFKKYGITTVSASCTMGYMCSTLNPWHLTNIYDFYEYALEEGVYGTLITDWQSHLGYHSEHMMLHFAASAVLSWCGGKDGFIEGMSREEFYREYCKDEYGTDKMVDYINLSGLFESPLLAPFRTNDRGGALREFVFHQVNPLRVYLYLYPYLGVSSVFDEYCKQVEILEQMWTEITSYERHGYSQVMVLPVMIHTTIRDYFAATHRAYQAYHEASLLQFEDKKAFGEKLDTASAEISKLIGVFDKLLQYVKLEYKLLGNDYVTIGRILELKKNIKTLSSYFLNLKKGYRLLPSFTDIEKCLFGYFPEGLWNNSELDWALEPKQFQTVDYYSGDSNFIEDVPCFNSKKDV